MNELKSAIGKSKKLIGTLISVASPAIAESLSTSGLDFLFFDMEHSVMSLADVQTMIQAMQRPCLSMIRIAEPQPVYVKQALDTGCDCLIIPQVNSAKIAETVVRAGKFPPAGGRSVGLGRAVGYGARLSRGIKEENERTSLVVQIEHADAVGEVDKIAAIEGVDALFIGPYDLSGSFGIPGEIDNPKVQEAINITLHAAQKANKPAGIFVGTVDAAKKEMARGFQFVVVGSDVARLTAAVRAMHEEVKAN